MSNHNFGKGLYKPNSIWSHVHWKVRFRTLKFSICRLLFHWSLFRLLPKRMRQLRKGEWAYTPQVSRSQTRYFVHQERLKTEIFAGASYKYGATGLLRSGRPGKAWRHLGGAEGQPGRHCCQPPRGEVGHTVHCKLATLSRRQKPMLPGGRYRSMSPAGRQSLQFYNEYIKWWPSANNFQCCPRAFGPRATLEIIGFGSPLDKASLRIRLQTRSLPWSWMSSSYLGTCSVYARVVNGGRELKIGKSVVWRWFPTSTDLCSSVTAHQHIITSASAYQHTSISTSAF